MAHGEHPCCLLAYCQWCKGYCIQFPSVKCFPKKGQQVFDGCVYAAAGLFRRERLA